MTRQLLLLRGQIALVDDADYPDLRIHRWRLNSKGYVIRSFSYDGVEKVVTLHRQIMQPPPDLVVDHIDHDKLNNTRDNLRLITRQQNQMYRRRFKNNSTGFKGVSCHGSRWQARIHYDGQTIYLGDHDDLKTAALAYDCAARQLFGEFALLNLPDQPYPDAVRDLVERRLNSLSRTVVSSTSGTIPTSR